MQIELSIICTAQTAERDGVLRASGMAGFDVHARKSPAGRYYLQGQEVNALATMSYGLPNVVFLVGIVLREQYLVFFFALQVHDARVAVRLCACTQTRVPVRKHVQRGGQIIC